MFAFEQESDNATSSDDSDEPVVVSNASKTRSGRTPSRRQANAVAPVEPQAAKSKSRPPKLKAAASGSETTNDPQQVVDVGARARLTALAKRYVADGVEKNLEAILAAVGKLDEEQAGTWRVWVQSLMNEGDEVVEVSTSFVGWSSILISYPVAASGWAFHHCRHA